MASTTVDQTITRGGLIWAIDGDGDLYTDTYKRTTTRKGKEKDDWRITRIDGSNGDVLKEIYADPIGAPNNYWYHKIGGFTFDTSDRLWLADWKKGKNPDGFLAKANSKGKFPYKKRIVGWSRDGAAPDTAFISLQAGLDGALYAISHTGPSGMEAVWSIE